MRMRRFFFPVLVLVLASLTPASADLTFYQGMNTFHVRVTNSYFKPVYDARGNCFVNGNYAQIQVEAPGYRRAHTTVSVNANTHQYYCDVRLDDPSVQANVKTANGAWVDGAYVNYFSQSLYWGDEFGVRATLPKKGFEKLTEREIDVRVNYMFAMMPRIYLSDGGSRWNLEVVIKRRDMRDMFNTIDLIVTPDPVEPPPPATGTLVVENPLELANDYAFNQTFMANTDSQEIRDVLQGRLESLARRIRDVVQRLDAGEITSLVRKIGADSPLGREVRTIQTFNGLHQ